MRKNSKSKSSKKSKSNKENKDTLSIRNDPFKSKIEIHTKEVETRDTSNERNEAALKQISQILAAVKPNMVNDKVKAHLIVIHSLLCKIYRRREHFKALKAKKDGTLVVDKDSFGKPRASVSNMFSEQLKSKKKKPCSKKK